MRKLLAVALLFGLVTIGCKKSDTSGTSRPPTNPGMVPSLPTDTKGAATKPTGPVIPPPPPPAAMEIDAKDVTVKQGGTVDVKVTRKNNAKALAIDVKAPEGLTATGKFEEDKDTATVTIKAADTAKEGDHEVTITSGTASKKITVKVEKK